MIMVTMMVSSTRRATFFGALAQLVRAPDRDYYKGNPRESCNKVDDGSSPSGSRKLAAFVHSMSCKNNG